MEREPYQLLLWREGYNPEPKKESSYPKESPQSVDNAKPSEDIFKGFLNGIDENLRRWISGIEDSGNRKNAELADRFIQQSNLKKKIPAMLAQMGFEKDYRQKFPQYGLYFSKIRKHIIGVLRNDKIRQSQENELKKLATHSLLAEKSEQVTSILESVSSLAQKIQRVRNLLDALMRNQGEK